VYRIERAAGETLSVRLLRPRAAVGRNVWYLGVTSLFTDVSAEMVASVLPAYLVLGLGFSPFAFGAIDGVYQGAGSIVRWAGGAAADRWRRYKDVAFVGYFVSAACKIGLLAASGWTAIATVIAIDRMAKGFRTAPRDALISLSSETPSLGTAFGVHRSLDATGALLGPLVAFGILAAAPRAFENVFVVSFSAALVGLGVLVLFVENVTSAREPSSVVPPLRAIRSLLQNRSFRVMLASATALTLATVGDAFVYLQVQHNARFSAAAFPLMAFATAGTYMLLAAPAGRIADRVGTSRIFVLGHVVLLPLYATLTLAGSSLAIAVLTVCLLGTYYALTDGVLAAAASAALGPDIRATGLAVLGTAVSVARLTSSLAFGGLWTVWGPRAAIVTFAGALVAAVVFAMLSLRTATRTGTR